MNTKTKIVVVKGTKKQAAPMPCLPMYFAG